MRALILTGRTESVRAEVRAFLANNDVALPASNIVFRSAGTRGAFKGAALDRLLDSRFSRVTRVTVWDDDPASLQEYAELRSRRLQTGCLRRFHLVDATSLPSPPAAPVGETCRAFLRERLRPQERKSPDSSALSLILDCWRFAIGAAPDGLAEGTPGRAASACKTHAAVWIASTRPNRQ